MSEQTPTHEGCRVCGRTDVSLKKNGTLRQHVNAAYKGSGFMRPGGSRCDGVGHPPKGALGRYAQATLDVLREEFPDLEKANIAEMVGEAIQQHRIVPKPSLEILLDERGDWRLVADHYAHGMVTVMGLRTNESNEDRDRRRWVVIAMGEVRR